MSKEEEILAAVRDAVGFEPTSGLRLSYDAEGPFRVRVTGSRLDVTYAALDPMPPADYWGDERGTFRRFRSADAREKHVRRLIRAGAVVFDVVQSPDGVLQPAEIGTVEGPVAVLALPDHLADMVRDARMDDTEARRAAADLLEGYQAWSQGESLGLATDSFTVDTDATDLDYLDHSACWSVIGSVAASRRIDPEAPAPAVQVPGFP